MTTTVFSSYNTFGLRTEWIKILFENPEAIKNIGQKPKQDSFFIGARMSVYSTGNERLRFFLISSRHWGLKVLSCGASSGLMQLITSH